MEISLLLRISPALFSPNHSQGQSKKKKAWQQLFAHSSSVSASSSVIVRPNAKSETEAQTPGVYEQLRGVRLGQLRIVIERYCLGKFMYDNMKSFFLIGLLHNRYFKCTVWT
ncbi:hypothetical protein ACLB2K_017949 [Fragaria x ananassa]